MTLWWKVSKMLKIYEPPICIPYLPLYTMANNSHANYLPEENQAEWPQAEWGILDGWRIGCHPEGSGQAWEVGNLIRFQKTKYKILHPGQGKLHCWFRLGKNRLRQPCRHGLGVVGRWEAKYELAMCTLSPESQEYSGQ